MHLGTVTVARDLRVGDCVLLFDESGSSLAVIEQIESMMFDQVNKGLRIFLAHRNDDSYAGIVTLKPDATVITAGGWV